MERNNSKAKGQSTPLDVVNSRTEVNNNHDLKAILAMYSDKIQVYDNPDIPIGTKGKDHIKGIFEPLFKDRAVSVKILHQIDHGNNFVTLPAPKGGGI